MRMRAYGIYAYHVADPRMFYQKVSGTRRLYRVAELEGQLPQHHHRPHDRYVWEAAASTSSTWRETRPQLGSAMLEALRPVFADLGLALDSFVVESISLPEELQKMLDQRIGMNMIGDMGRYTQFQVAQSMPIAAANEGGGAAAPALVWARGWRWASR